MTNLTYINSGTVCELLRKVDSLHLQTPVTLVLDNASYQRCHLVQNLAAELNIELLFLPSYSPNLNLIERLWKFVKKKVLYSKYYETFEEFQSAIDDCLDQLVTTYQQEICDLISHKFQTFESVPFLTA